MRIRRLCEADASQWLPLRQALWPDLPPAQLRDELAQIAADERQIALGAFETTALVGFVELSLHPHAVGCGRGPVGYLEAWYVAERHRRTGIGRRLVAAGEDWARAQGCRDLASDTWLGNDVSHAAHLSLGFTEAQRLIHYQKRL